MDYMGKALIIAEKPSVAGDISRALGGFKKQDDYYESEQYLLSSAVGHLLELCVPEQFEVKRGKWSFAHLPVIPPHFDLRPKGIVRMLDLLRPIYCKTAAYGHFGRDEPEFTWEATDKAEVLREAAGLRAAIAAD